MAVTPRVSYPGVYIEELPSGVHTIVSQPTAITAFIGRAKYGPVNEPISITNVGEFDTRFGGLWAESPMTYAVMDYFLNGGSEAIIVRLFESPTDGADGVAKGTQLKLVAADAGAWGNNLQVWLDRDGITDAVAEQVIGQGASADTLFNLTITDGARTERLTNVTLLDGPRRLDNVLAQASSLIRVAPQSPDVPASLPNPLPDKGNPITFSGGVDCDSLSARAYFGGADGEKNQTGMYALDKAYVFTLMCIPPDQRGGNTDPDVYRKAMAYCYQRRALLIIDAPIEWGRAKETAAATAQAGYQALRYGEQGEASRNAAIYFPRVVKNDPLRGNQPDVFVPCGIIAGIMAQTDTNRGVWKAPAGTEAILGGIRGLQVNLTDEDSALLNPLGINVLRHFPVYGDVVWGARTTRGADQMADDYKYVPVRRLALMIEEALVRGTNWAVFEPNDEALWSSLRRDIGTYMRDLWQQGAFVGQSADEAYFIKCDATTTTAADQANGIVNILVGFAPLRPAEFLLIHIQIQQAAGYVAP